MNLYEFLSTLWWPIVVIVAVILLAKPFQAFVRDRMDSLDIEAGPAKLRLSGRVQEAADRALEATSNTVQASDSEEVVEATTRTSDFYERMMTLSYTEPAAAITESYKELEAAMRRALQSNGQSGERLRYGAALLNEFGKTQLLPRSEVHLLREAVNLRNRAAHETDPIPVGVAANYVELIRQLLISIRLAQGLVEGD